MGRANNSGGVADEAVAQSQVGAGKDKLHPVESKKIDNHALARPRKRRKIGGCNGRVY